MFKSCHQRNLVEYNFLLSKWQKKQTWRCIRDLITTDTTEVLLKVLGGCYGRCTGLGGQWGESDKQETAASL